MATGASIPLFGGRGRRRRGDIRIALLMALSEEPRNGYQLMQTIEERSGGHWRPSPGSVYPALAQLEDERLIKACERDGTKMFELAAAGRRLLERREDPTPPWIPDADSPSVGDFKSQIKQLNMAAAMVIRGGDERQLAAAVETLAESRRSLYRILADEDADG